MVCPIFTMGKKEENFSFNNFELDGITIRLLDIYQQI